MRSPHVLTRVSVPFAQGELVDPMSVVISSSTGAAVPVQGRSILDWEDGSCKWGLFVFEPGEDQGPFTLEQGHNELADQPLVREVGDVCKVDTGKIVLEIPVIRSWLNAISYPPLVAGLSYKDESGVLHPILRGTGHMGFRIQEKDGRTFLSERILDRTILRNEPLRCHTREVCVVESGPVRAWIQIRGISAADIFSPGLDYVIQIETYRNSSLVKFTVTWRHADDQNYHHIRDLRFALPFAQRAQRVTTGMQYGATTDRIMPGSVYRVLQEDEHTYYADRFDPSGERVGLAWGSGHGQHAPGWMQARFDDARLSVAMQDFVREYPNEIRIDENEVSFGLWPGDAAQRIASKRILPVHPDTAQDPQLRHRHTKYDNLACHPYWAFFDKAGLCLETVRGMQKTQVIWCDVSPGLDSVQWNRRVRSGTLEINQARVVCDDLRRSAVYGYIRQLDPDKNPEFARVLNAGATWLKNHEEAYNVKGKFDAGDLVYMWMSQSHTKDTDTKHTARREHSRMGYWNNNEEDPCHGLMTYFLATGDVGAYQTAARMARHLWDIDVQHYPHLGVFTHAYGHCFRAYPPTATDHFWIEGLMDYYLLVGDPEIKQGLSGLAQFLASQTEHVRPVETDLRTVALLLMQLVNYRDFGDRTAMLERARRLAEQLMAEQHKAGYFPTFGSAAIRRFAQDKTPGYDTPATAGQSTWFSTLALQGIMGLCAIDPDPRWRRMFYRQLDFIVDNCLYGKFALLDERVRLDADTIAPGSLGEDQAHSGLATWEFQTILVFAYNDRRDVKYLDLGRRMMKYFTSMRFCAPEWGKRLEGMEVPQTCRDDDGEIIPATPQKNDAGTRPLNPSTTLRCLPAMMALLIDTQSP